ncbi:MAG: efflux RND transporter periplasmic adaptor subunit [Candidatus Delongbacteria bacterium]|jgi:HlyD family secretion protein|nr:efflux RND transporter periplasmic adaptor subunit [Candidatus Delongbacteria bacterium]MDY0018118.1 efflux RND transporter periplasmic adaptor subunit [Candidatus Delongbacteria bacterium]
MAGRKKKWFWTILILVILSVSLPMIFKKDKLTEVESDKAVRKTIVKTISASGMIEPVKNVNISSEISANLDSLLVSEGQQVKKGQLLARLDRKNILAEVEQQKAALSQQKFSSNNALLNLKKIKLEYDNQAKLRENNFISENEFENIRINYEIAKTSYESSLENIKLQTAYLDQAQDRLSKTDIYAPLDGIVTKLYKEQGEIVLGSQFNTDVILSIADMNDFKVNVDVDENDVAFISTADSVKITIDAFGETVFKGIVTEIGNTPLNLGSTESSVEYSVSVNLITKDSRIKPGMTTYAEIVTDVVNDVLSVPIQALARRKKEDTDKDKNTVSTTGIEWNGRNDYSDVLFRLKKLTDSEKEKIYEVEKVTVKTGIANERFIEITEGIFEDDMIVSGDYKTISKVLENGMKVKVK